MWTVEQLRAQGASTAQIAAIRKRTTKVRHGVYTEDEDPWEVYRLRCLAVASAITGAVLAGPSAALLWDLYLVGDPPKYVFIRGVTRGRYGHDVSVVDDRTEAVDVDGVLVSTAAWTVADCARLLQRRDALIVADHALHLQRCDFDDLRMVAKQLGRAKGIHKVRWVIANADPRSESAGETWLRMIARDLGYQVTSQVEIVDGSFVARVDLLVDGTRIVLEFDGLIKYDDSDPDVVGETIKKERRRQGRLESLGYQVLRFIWEQLFDRAQVQSRMAHAVRRSALSTED